MGDGADDLEFREMGLTGFDPFERPKSETTIPNIEDDTPRWAWDRACLAMRKEFCASLKHSGFESAAHVMQGHPLPDYDIEEML